MELIRGQKVKLSDLSSQLQLRVEVHIVGFSPEELDIACFGLAAGDKLEDDRYFVFYNQPQSPGGEIRKLGPAPGLEERFALNLAALPTSITKLSFVATIDGPGQMSQIGGGFILRRELAGRELARFQLRGQDYAQEKALILAELYFKDLWRWAARGQGFNGGLEALLIYFGGSVAAEDPQDEAPQPAPPSPQRALVPWQFQLHSIQRPAWGWTGNAPLLHLGALLQLTSGTKYVLQELGGLWGAKEEAPYVTLATSAGPPRSQKLTCYKPATIERLLLFCFAQGGDSLQGLGARLEVTTPQGEVQTLPLLQPRPHAPFCVIATLQGQGSTQQLQRQELYFSDHAQADRHFQFGLDWRQA